MLNQKKGINFAEIFGFFSKCRRQWVNGNWLEILLRLIKISILILYSLLSIHFLSASLCELLLYFLDKYCMFSFKGSEDHDDYFFFHLFFKGKKDIRVYMRRFFWIFFLIKRYFKIWHIISHSWLYWLNLDIINSLILIWLSSS